MVMNEATQKIMSSLDTTTFDALEISGRAWSSTDFKTYTAVSYPQFDVCNIADDYKNSYNIIIAEQVLEHIRNPFKGVSNVYDMLRPNGYFFVTTPFFLKIHGAPNDYWRWTPMGLTAMLEDCGFTVELSEAWGNKDCVAGNLDQWKIYEPGLNLNNEPEFPVVCWTLAKKII